MKKIYHIRGMTCKSCEVLLERDLKKIKGVEKVNASHAKGLVEVYSGDEIDRKVIVTFIEKSGEYKVLDDHQKKHTERPARDSMDYLNLAALFLLVGVVVFVLGQLGIGRYLPELNGQVGFLVAMGLGVVASFSTCLALVGGVVMSFGEAYPVAEDRKHPLLSRLLPHLYFHAGRVGGFVLLGGLLGILGSQLSYSIRVNGILTILVAVVMLYIGLQVLGFVPNISKLGFALPNGVARRLDGISLKNHSLMPVLVGLLTFFVPCGFTQSMQLASVASGSFMGGALIMGAFALGTMPVLLAIGFGSSYAKKDRFGLLNQLIAVVIIFFGLYSLNSGLILAGVPFNFSVSEQGVSERVTLNGEVQVVKMNVDPGFSPNSFTIKKGIPVRWEINGIRVSGCTNEIVIPKLGIRQRLGAGMNIIEFTPEEAGTLPFSCWMGMVSGRFNIID